MDENTYSHRKANLIFIFLLVISIFLMTAHLNEYIRGLKKILFYILIPTPEISTNIISSNHKLFRNIKGLIKAHQENLLLRKKIKKYIQIENEWIQTKEENIRLRHLVGFAVPQMAKKIVAKVIVREPSSWFQWIVINKGSKDGIVINSPVLVWVNDKLCVLGRTGEVYKDYSKVILITNALSALPAMISSNREDGLIEGQNTSVLRLNYLVSKKNITIGEDVVTSPLSSVLPSKMLIGQIQDLAPSKDERFHSALVKPSINFSNLREVVVLGL